MSVHKLNSEILFKGRVFDVQRDRVRFSDGHVTDLDFVIHRGAVTIVPIDDKDCIWFVYQYRHAIGAWLLELPAGSVENQESFQKCAHRELQEEIGLAAGHLELMGEFYLAPGYSTEYMYVYLATELYPEPMKTDRDELIQVRSYAISDVMSMMDSGMIQDAKSLAGLSMARHYLDVK